MKYRISNLHSFQLRAGKSIALYDIIEVLEVGWCIPERFSMLILHYFGNLLSVASIIARLIWMGRQEWCLKTSTVNRNHFSYLITTRICLFSQATARLYSNILKTTPIIAYFDENPRLARKVCCASFELFANRNVYIKKNFKRKHMLREYARGPVDVKAWAAISATICDHVSDDNS